MWVSRVIWSLVLVLGVIGLMIGIALPIIPHVPFLLVIIYSLLNLAPNYTRRMRLYRRFVSPLVHKRRIKKRRKQREQAKKHNNNKL